MPFDDHFSAIAPAYRDHRPRYPEALFAHLASRAARHELAWDCACGSGQATLPLAPHFRRVAGTDASAAQVQLAPPHPRVTYHVAPAERVPLTARSADLVTVAQALHWLPLDPFYAEVRRVLRPRGVIAAWAYGRHQVEPGVDQVIERLYHDIVGPCWPPQRRFIDERYQTIPFPFDELAAGPFEMAHEWTLAELRGYLATWSAVHRYQEQEGADPLALIAPELAAAWGPPERRRTIRWPLFLRVGRLAD
jgi:SAM-dependent methyltransferase